MKENFGIQLPNGGIIRSIEDLRNTEREVQWGNGTSYRFLINKDGKPYTITHTIVNKGTTSNLQYKNHVEACYCIKGKGFIEVDGIKYEISVGKLYAPQHNKHLLIADKNEDLHFVCVFSPPLQGDEKHNLTDKNKSGY